MPFPRYAILGDTIKVEKLDAEAGKKITFDQVLLIADGDDVKIGTPFLTGKKVSGEVVEQGRHKKIEIIKFHRRKHHMKHMGHRQDFTAVKITDLDGTAKPKTAASKPAPEKTADTKAAAEKPAVKKPAAKKAPVFCAAISK